MSRRIHMNRACGRALASQDTRKQFQAFLTIRGLPKSLCAAASVRAKCSERPGKIDALTLWEGWPPPNQCIITEEPSEGWNAPSVLPKRLLVPIGAGCAFCSARPTIGAGAK